jgi:hypothetical protein
MESRLKVGESKAKKHVPDVADDRGIAQHISVDHSGWLSTLTLSDNFDSTF